MAEIADQECALITLVRKFYEDRMTPEIEAELDDGDLHAITVRLRDNLHAAARRFSFVPLEQVEEAINSNDNEALYRCYYEEVRRLKEAASADPEEQNRYEAFKWVITEVFCGKLP